jgi:hypothetical protein
VTTLQTLDLPLQFVALPEFQRAQGTPLGHHPLDLGVDTAHSARRGVALLS